MTYLYYDAIFMEHDTGNHPENAGRLQSVVRHLSFVGLDALCKRMPCPTVSLDRLKYVHEQTYIEQVETFARRGGGHLDADTVVCPRSYAVAATAAGAVCDATTQVLSGATKNAFCMLRPPGHHALPDRAMGFCLFNNVALAAQTAIREFGLERVLIVDWDVHHGNGTQDIFYREPRVGFLSIHRYPFWPGTGAAEEIGEEQGRGTNRNLPVEFGTPRDKQLALFDRELTDFAAKLKPQLVLLSAGFDSHKNDPVGSLGLESEDFQTLSATVLAIADQHCEGRLVSMLEGGYDPAALAECVEIHLQALVEVE
jgi:acetoin utilization deacetylase AcuC-like enzyme